MWMEHEASQRINEVRMDEIEKLTPDLAAVACPFCLIMLQEAATGRGADSALPVVDIAEIIAAGL